MKTFICFSTILFCLVLPIIGNAQFVLVTGNIMNQKTGDLLESVNIFESNSGIGTITNMNGYFSLMLKPGKVEFVITQNGFKDFSKKMDLKSDTTLTVSLIPAFNLKAKQKDSESQKTAEKLEREKSK
jgi:hypothetical protein